jgi:membrane protein required for colicin V production
MPPNVREHLHPGNLPVHLPDLHNVLPPPNAPAHGSTSPDAASSASGTTH